jgi:hypothetical protein
MSVKSVMLNMVVPEPTSNKPSQAALKAIEDTLDKVYLGNKETYRKTLLSAVATPSQLAGTSGLLSTVIANSQPNTITAGIVSVCKATLFSLEGTLTKANSANKAPKIQNQANTTTENTVKAEKSTYKPRFGG